MQFSFPKLAWSETVFDRLLKAIKDGIEKADYDSGWIAAPTGGIFSHSLGVIPTEIWVYESDNSDGSAFSQILPTSVTRTGITITATKAYCRARANKGG